MAGRGKAPTPTKLLKLRGSKWDQHRRSGITGDDEMEPEVGIPSCPRGLCTEAKAEWKRVVKAIGTTGVLTLAERAALAGYCDAWAEFYAATQCIAKEGRTFKTPQGYIAKNPMVTILHEARAAMLKFAQDLGLTPAARTRVQGSQKKDADNSLENFVKRGPKRKMG